MKFLRDIHEILKEIYESPGGSPPKSLRESLKFLKDPYEILKKVYETLKDILKDIREIPKGSP